MYFGLFDFGVYFNIKKKKYILHSNEDKFALALRVLNSSQMVTRYCFFLYGEVVSRDEDI